MAPDPSFDSATTTNSPVVEAPPSWLLAGSMTVLLVMLISTVFVIPVIFPSGEMARPARDISFTLILLSGAVAIYKQHAASLVAVILCLIAIIVRWAEFIVPVSMQAAVREGASLLALALITTIVATRVFAGGIVTADRIMGAVVLYLLI